MLIRIPLGPRKGDHYQICYLATSRGWHWKYLYVRCTREQGLQWQTEYLPMTVWSFKYK